jgi:hypothetical protein
MSGLAKVDVIQDIFEKLRLLSSSEDPQSVPTRLSLALPQPHSIVAAHDSAGEDRGAQ